MAATDPTGYISIPLELIRGMAWKRPVRCATTGTITIATALNVGDSIDGITLADGDRVLVKDQSTGSQNGIYVAGATPTRAFDMDQDLTTSVPAEEIAGAFVYVLAGTANAGKIFHTTNVGGGTIGSTSIVWTEFSGGGGGSSADVTDGSTTVTAPDTIEFVGTGDASVTVTESPSGTARVEIDATAGGGGGGGAPAFYLDTYSLPRDGTMGDDFDGASLNARWTRKNIVSGMETYQSSDGSWLRVDMAGTATAAQQYQQTLPGGDWEFICSMTFYCQATSSVMYGMVAYDNSGNGTGPVAYPNDSNSYLGIIASFTYSSNGGGIAIDLRPNAKKIWYRLKKVSTTYTASISLDGMNWSKDTSRTDATSMTMIAIGRIFGGSTDEILCIDMFDRVA